MKAVTVKQARLVIFCYVYQENPISYILNIRNNVLKHAFLQTLAKVSFKSQNEFVARDISIFILNLSSDVTLCTQTSLFFCEHSLSQSNQYLLHNIYFPFYIFAYLSDHQRESGLWTTSHVDFETFTHFMSILQIYCFILSFCMVYLSFVWLFFSTHVWRYLCPAELASIVLDGVH